MEAVIEEEIKILCDHIKGYHNKTLTIKHFFHYSLHNVIWSVVGGKWRIFLSSSSSFGQYHHFYNLSRLFFFKGKRFDQGDKLMHQLSELTDVLLTQLNLTSAIMFMPYLQFFYKNDIYKLKHASDILNKHLESEVNDHIASYQDGCQRDIIDVYLNEIFTREKSGNTSKSFQRKDKIFSFLMKSVIKSK